VKHGSTMNYPPAWWLVVVVVATPLVVGALTILPSRAASRASVARTLRSEAA
jgi:ABC-type lipoprotein release transport system permease subunit